jgi:hypothetical protein
MKRLTRIRMRVEEWRWTVQDSLAWAYQAVKPLAPHLPGFVTWLLLTFCTSWVVAQWVAQGVVKKELTSAPRGPSFQRAALTPVTQQEPVPATAGNTGGRPYLGIRGKEIRQGGIHGVKVLEVFPGAPAATAGLRAAPDPPPSSRNTPDKPGHIIIGANGQLIHSEETLAKVIAQSSPGSVLTLLVIDGDSYEIIPVTLGAIPETSSMILTSAEGTSPPLSRGGGEKVLPR